jgi:ribokinase
MLHALQKEGVNITNIQVLSGVKTGTAHITVTEGDNTIVVVPAANAKVAPEMIASIESLLHQASICD